MWAAQGSARSRLVPTGIVALYVLALAARLSCLSGDTWEWESLRFSMSRHLGTEDPTVRLIDGPLGDAAPIFWERPLFYVLMHLPAQHSLEAARLVSSMITAAIAPLTALLLRARGSPWPLALGAAVAAAIHPAFVIPGARLATPALAAVAVAGAVLLRSKGQPLAAGGLLLAASWIDETSLILVAAWLVYELWSGRRSGASTFWPLALTRSQTSLLVALALRMLPSLLIEPSRYYPAFGMTQDHAFRDVPDLLLLSFWALPLLVAGAFFSRSRASALAALTIVGALLWLARKHDAAPERAVAALTGLVVVVAVAEALGEVAGRLPRPGRIGATALVMLLVLVSVLGPGVALARAVQPLSSTPQNSLPVAVAGARRVDPDREMALATAESGPWSNLVLIDVPWFDVYEPYVFRIRPEATVLAYTSSSTSFELYAQAIERNESVTMLALGSAPLGQALLRAYTDCAVLSNERFAVLDGRVCEGGLGVQAGLGESGTTGGL